MTSTWRLFLASLIALSFQSSFGQDRSGCFDRTVWVYDPLLTGENWDATDSASVAQRLARFQLGYEFWKILKLKEPEETGLHSMCLTVADFIAPAMAQSNPGVLKDCYDRTGVRDLGGDHYNIAFQVRTSGSEQQCFALLETKGDGRPVSIVSSVTNEVSTFTAQALYVDMAPLHEAIEAWEKEEREVGAIVNPQISVTPEAPMLMPAESAVMTIHVEDCDGPLLKKEGVAVALVDVSGGTIDKTALTLDAQAEASFTFTAESTPMVGGVTAQISYTTPWGTQKTANQRIPIQIAKPKDAWYCAVAYCTDQNRQSTTQVSGGMTTISEWKSQEWLAFHAWVKAADLGDPFHLLPDYFVADQPEITLEYNGGSAEYGRSVESLRNDVGFISTISNSDIKTIINKAKAPTVKINISPKRCSFTIEGVNAARSGNIVTNNMTFNIVNGFDFSQSFDSPSPTRTVTANVSTFSRDTTYTVLVTSPTSSERTNVTQTAHWKDYECRLDYTETYTSETTVDQGVYQENSTWKVSKWVTAYLSTDPPQTGVAHGLPDLPLCYALEQNHPNPFNPTTRIRYQVPGASDVKLTVYDLLGREVVVLVDEMKDPGSYEVKFDGTGLSSGVYVYRMQAKSFTETKKLLLIR